jgi:hypothetical protein
VTRRPFREVHHSASKQSLVGGGSGVPEPGEISLAHKGVLFLDETAQFSRPTIETLRQPLESGTITISRVDASLEFPGGIHARGGNESRPCGFFGMYNCSQCGELVFEPGRGCAKCGSVQATPRLLGRIQGGREVSGPDQRPDSGSHRSEGRSETVVVRREVRRGGQRELGGDPARVEAARTVQTVASDMPAQASRRTRSSPAGK